MSNEKREAFTITQDWKKEAIIEKGADWKQEGIIVDASKEIPPEERKYLLLQVYYDRDAEEEVRTFEWIKGRTLLYNTLKLYIQSDICDLYESKIISERKTIMDAITVLQFMRHVIGGELVEDDTDFDLNDYIIGDEWDLEEDGRKGD